MREILFRGICTETGDWVNGFYVRLNCKEHRIYSGYAETDCGDYYPDWEQVAPDTVGQFTGMTDKNGKRIFERDIVRAKFCGKHQGTFTIEFINGCFYAVPVGGTIDSLRPWKYSVGGENGNMEVIGNIHDNPELLENP